MSRPVLVLRPEPGLSATIEKGRELGLTMVGAPLFTIQPLAWTLPDTSHVDALLAGSGNVFRHGGGNLAQLRHLPVYAVGQVTAELAEQAGFTVAQIGGGGLQSVVDANISENRHYLRLGGEDRVALKLGPTQSVEEITVYRAVPEQLGSDAQELLGKGPVVALHSAKAVEHFGAECERLGIDRNTIDLAVLGPRIGAAAGSEWRDIAIAPEPSDTALLEMITTMCQ